MEAFEAYEHDAPRHSRGNSVDDELLPEGSGGYQAPTNLPAEVIRYHLVPKLSLASLRAFRRASRGAREDASACAISAIRRPPGTYPLPPDLGARFPRLVHLDLSGDTQLNGGLSLFRALQSAKTLTSLSLAGCSSLPASFVARQLTAACPRLQHLALSCCCAAPPDSEGPLMAALASAPLAATLTSLDLHCAAAFQPEIQDLGPQGPHGPGGPGLGAALRSLRMYGSRTLDDKAVAALPLLAPALTRLHLGEQLSRRGWHIEGHGLVALRGLAALRELSLACSEPDPGSMMTALATLTQLEDLDLSRCEPRLVAAAAPLAALLGGGVGGDAGGAGGAAAGGGAGGVGSLRRLALPTAYTKQQLACGVPAMLGARDGGGAEGGAAASGVSGDIAPPWGPPALRALRLHASTQFPDEVVRALGQLVRLQELNLSQCGPPGRSAAAVAAALTGLTSLHLVQEYGGDAAGDDGDDDDGGGSGEGSAGGCGAMEAGEGGGAAAAHACYGGATWYGSLSSWGSLRQLVLTDVDTLRDSHLLEMGRNLTSLTSFSLSRNLRVSGEGFASWPAACTRLTALTLYDCACVGDAAVRHLAALTLRTLTLAHLPDVGADGVRHLAATCTTLASLTLERLAGVPGTALAALWRLPVLEVLSLRMCAVTNLTLQEALEGGGDEGRGTETDPGHKPAGTAAVAASTGRRPFSGAPSGAPGGGGAAAAGQLGGQGPGSGAKSGTGGGSGSGTGAAAGSSAANEGGAGGVGYGGEVRRGGTTQAESSTTMAAGMPAGPSAQRLSWLELQGTLVTTSGLRALRGAPGLTHLDLSSCPNVGDGVVDVLLHGGGGGGGSGNAGAGVGRGGCGGWLLPSLVHIDLRGCMVQDATVERLRAAGLAVNTGAGIWR